MEIAWEVQYDQGVLPLIVESNPDGSGHRIFRTVEPNETDSPWWIFATHKRSAKNREPPTNPKGFGPGCEGISHGIGIAPGP